MIEAIQLKLANQKVLSQKENNKENNFYLVESFAEKTRLYWPYITLFIIGACIASIVLICCACHRIRKTMYNKRKTKGNFESKYIKLINT